MVLLLVLVRAMWLWRKPQLQLQLQLLLLRLLRLLLSRRETLPLPALRSFCAIGALSRGSWRGLVLLLKTLLPPSRRVRIGGTVPRRDRIPSIRRSRLDCRMTIRLLVKSRLRPRLSRLDR